MTDYRHQPPGPEQLWTNPDSPRWEGTHQNPEPKLNRMPLWWTLIALGSILAICSGLIGLVAFLAFAAGDKPDPVMAPAVPAATAPAAPAAPAASTPAADPAPTTYKIGKAFPSGDLTYTIHGVKETGKQPAGVKPQGVFTPVDITVKSVGRTPVLFDINSLIKVEDKDGRQFNSTSIANAVGNTGGTGWPSEINPGNQVRVVVFFDLPTSVKAVRVVVSAGTPAFKTDAIVPLGADR